MKIRRVKKAIRRFKREEKRGYKYGYRLNLLSKYIAIEMCLEQLKDDPNRKCIDEFKVHFKNFEHLKYKTLKTAFINDIIKEGMKVIKEIKP